MQVKRQVYILVFISLKAQPLEIRGGGMDHESWLIPAILIGAPYYQFFL